MNDELERAVRAVLTWITDPQMSQWRYLEGGDMYADIRRHADALRAALAAPQGEPVAWRFQSAVGGWAYNSQPPLGIKYPAYPLYASPQPQQTEPSQDTPPQHEYEVTANDDGTFSVGLPDGEELRIIPPQRPAAPSVPAGWKLLRDTTRDERSWPEDEKLENGAYFNNCLHCLRQFVGHKRRRVCRACDAAPSGEEVGNGKS